MKNAPVAQIRSSLAAVASWLDSLEAMEAEEAPVESAPVETPVSKPGEIQTFQKKITLGQTRNIAEGELAVPDEVEKILDIDWETTREMAEKDSEIHRAHQVLSSDRQSIIFVASLIEKIPNLAGLSRTCEIFKAEALALDNILVERDAYFQSISVTASKWLPLVEVKREEIKGYLREKKLEGYTILGLEQASNSISLQTFKFPKKCVFLLGEEREGIPVDLLHCLDQCIEIPQLGVVRSFNVHVSASLVLWQYSQQQALGIKF
eukprot:TRINITY_DN12965_c0_g1_i1.p1 TRINITY_DN12965_c0_g1~~TRINITY_DN12965_c0_g1_i1.p1  ORF type:complete len:264 (+),score=105.13 TRINITY_DN12965_c0_g1_i1:292-1083(+)